MSINTVSSNNMHHQEIKVSLVVSQIFSQWKYFDLQFDQDALEKNIIQRKSTTKVKVTLEFNLFDLKNKFEL